MPLGCKVNEFGHLFESWTCSAPGEIHSRYVRRHRNKPKVIDIWGALREIGAYPPTDRTREPSPPHTGKDNVGQPIQASHDDIRELAFRDAAVFYNERFRLNSYLITFLGDSLWQQSVSAFLPEGETFRG